MWSVCLSAGLVLEPYKNSWTDSDAVWGLTCVGPRNRVLNGGKIPQEGAMLGVVRPMKKQCMRQKGSFNLQSSTTAWQPTAMLQTGRCYITLSPVKNKFDPVRYGPDAAFRQNSFDDLLLGLSVVSATLFDLVASFYSRSRLWYGCFEEYFLFNFWHSDSTYVRKMEPRFSPFSYTRTSLSEL